MWQEANYEGLATDNDEMEELQEDPSEISRGGQELLGSGDDLRRVQAATAWDSTV